MSDIDLNAIQVEKVIDARGSACPGPLLEAKKLLTGITVEALTIWHIGLAAQKFT